MRACKPCAYLPSVCLLVLRVTLLSRCPPFVVNFTKSRCGNGTAGERRSGRCARRFASWGNSVGGIVRKIFRWKFLRWVLHSVLLVCVGIQFVPVDRSNPLVETEVPAPANVRA